MIAIPRDLARSFRAVASKCLAGRPRGPAPPAQRATVIPAHNADPAALAQLLSKHSPGRAEVSPLPAGSAGGLLVTASPAVTDEITKLVDALDRKARTVEVEVVLAEVPAKKGADGRDADVDLSGDVAAALDALARSGRATVRRVKLTAVEGRPVTSTTGGSKPVTAATAFGGGGRGGGAGGPGGGFGGPGQRSVSYHPVGTTVLMLGRVGADNSVVVELSVQDSRARQPDAADEAASFETATLTTQVSVPAGKAVVARAVRADGKAGGTLSVVLVTARVVEPGVTKSK